MTASIAANLRAANAAITDAAQRAGRAPSSVRLVAVSKMHPAGAVREAYAAGQRAFGENRVQELAAKARDVADLGDVQWHMIGSLQTNKVRELLAVPGLALLHSLDRVRLADELQRELERLGRRLDVLVQVHATDEPTKHGVLPADVPALLAHVQASCPDVVPVGFMAMGPARGDPAPAFAAVAALQSRSRRDFGLPLPVLSLGMSGDFVAAIAAGSTLVRIGAAVFGERS